MLIPFLYQIQNQSEKISIFGTQDKPEAAPPVSEPPSPAQTESPERDKIFKTKHFAYRLIHKSKACFCACGDRKWEGLNVFEIY